jgi:hypothetical protein
VGRSFVPPIGAPGRRIKLNGLDEPAASRPAGLVAQKAKNWPKPRLRLGREEW